MSQIQQIKDANSILEIVGERLSLTPAGNHYRGLCPFHGEKSPSFTVTESLGIYKCYGCQAGGDVIKFLEEYDGMTFREALEYLAQRAGIKLEQSFKKDTDVEHDKIMTILSDADDYFSLVLKHEIAGKVAREYLQKRGTNSEMIKLFRLGATSESWDGLTRYLTQNKRHHTGDIIKAGLILKSSKSERHFDRFRNRLIFPLKNHRGQIVGFSGRILSNADPKDAKYVNTPETMVYHKGQLFYGLSENIQAIKREKSVIVVEGEFDMISSVQAFVGNIVAIKGSAFTNDHAKLIKRYVQKVILALDADSAGMEATKKAALVLEKENVKLRVIIVPSGKDPDELASKSPKEWRELTKESISIYDFFLQTLQKKFDIKSIEGKTQFLAEIAPVFAQISNAVEYDHYLQKLSLLLEIRKEAAEEDLLKYQKQSFLNTKKNNKTDDDNHVSMMEIQTFAKIDDNRAKKELYLWFLLFNSSIDSINSKIRELQRDNFKWQTSEINLIAEKLFRFKGDFDLGNFNLTLNEKEQIIFRDLYLAPIFSKHLEKIDLEVEWHNLLKELRNDSIKSQLQSLNAELELIDYEENKSAENELRQEQLLIDIVRLQKLIKS